MYKLVPKPGCMCSLGRKHYALWSTFVCLALYKLLWTHSSKTLSVSIVRAPQSLFHHENHISRVPQPSPPTQSLTNQSFDPGITYSSYYSNDAERPNVCRLIHSGRAPPALTPGAYVPFVGTSAILDSQLFLLRLFYSADFPVKHFIVVVAKEVLTARTPLGYEVRHLQTHGANVNVVACDSHPTCAEGWNAVFQLFPAEPWGVYAARDSAWEPGSLRQLARHFWDPASRVDVGLMSW